MKPRRHLLRTLARLAALALAAAAPLSQAQADIAPDALVQKVSSDLIDTIRADRTLQTGDPARLNALVDQKVVPVVDFEKMTRLAVGRGWRQASAEQRAALVREFRTLLVFTYSGAVSAITDHKVQMRPFKMAPNDTDVVVRTQVVASRGDPIQLDYRLEKTDAGWKVYDFNVLGVWLVENYRNSFATEVNANGIDGLVKSLTERNRALGARR